MTSFGIGADVGEVAGVRALGADLRASGTQADGLPSTRRANRMRQRTTASVESTSRQVRKRWLWSATAACWAAYVSVAVWLVEVQQYMINDAISRTVSAQLMVASRDPHLAAVGFYWMPIPTVTRIPFVYLLDPFGQSVFAGPAASALFAAATVPVLVEIGCALRLRPRTIAFVVAAHALNPVTVYFAANGMSESTFGFFLALAVLLFVRWRNSADSRHLLLFGLAVAGCAACRHETLVLLPPLMAGIALSVTPENRRTTVTLAAVPVIALLAGWATISKLIVGDWFFWYTASRPTTATPEGAQWVPDELNPVTAVFHVGTLLLAYAPVLVPAALVVVLVRSRLATWTMVFGVALLLPAALAWQLADGSTWMVPRFLVHTPLLGAIIVLTVVSAANEQFGEGRLPTPSRTIARFVGWAALAVMPVGAITATVYLADVDRAHAEGEYMLMAPLMGRGDVRERPNHDGSNEVFDADLDAQRRLAADLDERVDAAAADGSAVLDTMVVMDSLQATTLLFSKHGDRFVVPEDRDFEEILSDPVGRFEFIVVLDGRAPTAFSELIAAELQREAADGGTWSLVATHPGAGTIQRFTPSRQSS